MITVACFARSAISVCIRSEPSTSLGFGGTLPAASTSRLFDFGVRCSTSASAARPASTSLRPAPPGSPIVFATIERRRSPSTRTTVVPAAASVRARLHAIVDLPSPGSGLVTTIVFGGWSTSMNWRLVRRARSASETAKVPLLPVLIRTSAESTSRVSSSSAGTIGMVPTTATPVCCSTSSAARIRRSDTVRIIANAMPKPRPRMPPTITAVWTSGKLGVEGSDASSPGRIVTGAEPGVPSPSISSISVFMRVDPGLGERAGLLRLGPCALTLMIVVSSGLETSIRFTRSSGVVLSPSSSMVWSATVRHPAISR